MPEPKSTKKSSATPAMKDLRVKKADADKVKGGATNLGPLD